jgi:hypothetical protein
MASGKNKIRVPRSLYDDDDAIIVVHWMADTISAVFNTEDRKAFLYESESRVDGPTPFVELFAGNHLLREYKDRLFKFEIHLDNKSGPCFRGMTLVEALTELLLLDTRHHIKVEWAKRFGDQT